MSSITVIGALFVTDPAVHSSVTVKLDLSMIPTPLNVPPKTFVELTPTEYVAQFGIPS